ncbi:MAG: dihydrodipicolinate reductase C-terminal domain-containing protein [Candidatus Hatepunaea meridiana]|nr:dihydrodipicolinate reductase C-terminal domain-containing protein [Candidatus Hatepunaea meridiana]
MIRVILFGAVGRMGKLVIEELQEQVDMTIVAGVEHPEHDSIGTSINDIPIIADGKELPEADVWVDFSFGEPALEHIRRASELGMPIVMPATGFDDKAIREIDKLSVSCPILMTPNLSTGIGVMERLIGDASRLFGNDFDPVLSEIHHTAKRDAPSGTALRLAQQVITDVEPPPIQIVSQRAGGAVGEHQIRFVGKDEELVITHRAWSRRAFSRGVPRAIRFIVEKESGMYSTTDMYGED